MTIQLEHPQDTIVSEQSILATVMGAPEGTSADEAFMNLWNEPRAQRRREVLDTLAATALTSMGTKVTPEISQAMLGMAQETADRLGMPGGYNAKMAVELLAAMATSPQNQ